MFSWAFARHHGGEFVLRIEDTDVACSSQDLVDQILAAMHWLGLDSRRGPDGTNCNALTATVRWWTGMLAEGTAYRCYTTPDELNAMKAAREARGPPP